MRIKKTSQYIEGGASLSNVYGTSDSNGYTQEYINNLETYSTTEQRIGTWIDGKPLYRKVLTKDLSSSTTATVGTLTNIDNIIITGHSQLIIKTTATNYIGPANSYESSSNWSKVFLSKNNSTNGVNITWLGNSTTGTIIVVCEYTKTTD